MELIVTILAAGAVMGLLDYLWLGTIARGLYYGEMGQILSKKPRMIPAVIFYIIYVIGVVVFVINPALEKGSFTDAALYGALFGMVAYATYDLTSLATMRGFSTKVAVIDMVWGTFITAMMASAGYLATKTLYVT